MKCVCYEGSECARRALTFTKVIKHGISGGESWSYLDLFGFGYPTIKQRIRRECMELRRKAYLCEDGRAFDFVEFLTIYPNPEIFFDEKRKTDEIYMKHALVCWTSGD